MSVTTVRYLNLFLSAIAAATIAACAVAATTHDPWPISVAALGSFATAIVQHLRQLPREEWSEEQRAEKTKEQPK